MPSFCSPSCSIFAEKVLPKMAQNTMDLHVLPNLEITTIIFIGFDI
jgi:hypothetical protein